MGMNLNFENLENLRISVTRSGLMQFTTDDRGVRFTQVVSSFTGEVLWAVFYEGLDKKQYMLPQYHRTFLQARRYAIREGVYE